MVRKDRTRATAASAPDESTAGGGVKPTTPHIQDIPQRPIKMHYVTDDVMQRIADAPRKKWDETTWAALGGLIAAAPSAVEAIHSACKRTPFSFEAFESLQVLIFIVFLVWFLARKGTKGEKTSTELLDELRNAPSGAEGSAGGARD